MSGLPYPTDFNSMPMPPAGNSANQQNYQPPPAYPGGYPVESSKKSSQGYPQQQAFVHGQPAPPPQSYPGHGYNQGSGYPQQSYH